MPKRAFKETDHPRGQPGNKGQFAPKTGAQAEPAALPKIDLTTTVGAAPQQPGTQGHAWAERQIDGLIDKAVALGYAREAACEGVGKAVRSAVGMFRNITEDAELKEQLLDIAKVTAEEAISDHYGSYGTYGTYRMSSWEECGNGSKVLEDSVEEWAKEVSRKCDKAECELDEFWVEPKEYLNDKPVGGGLYAGIISLVNGGQEYHPSLVEDSWVRDNSGWDDLGSIKDTVSGARLWVKCRQDPDGMSVIADFNGFWHFKEVHGINEGDYDAVFNDLESDIRYEIETSQTWF